MDWFIPNRPSGCLNKRKSYLREGLQCELCHDALQSVISSHNAKPGEDVRSYSNRPSGTLCQSPRETSCAETENPTHLETEEQIRVRGLSHGNDVPAGLHELERRHCVHG